MDVVVISLESMLNSSEYSEEQIEELLLTFSTINKESCPTATDVEEFLHKKAIRFDKSDISRTHLVFNGDNADLLGYFAISPKTWEISSKNYDKLTANQKNKLGLSKKNTEKTYKINGHLLGQLGLNYNENCRTNDFSGRDLLEVACKKIKEGYQILGGRITWLECSENEKLVNFYTEFGFASVTDFVSPNGYRVFFKRTKDL